LKKCKCCNNITQKEICDNHIYDYRYLKNFKLSENDMQNICLVETDLSIKYKYIIWKNGLSKHPSCKICDNKLSSKKILINNNTTSLCCSKDCYVKFKINQKEIINSDFSHISRDIKRELKKYCECVEDYIKILFDIYSTITMDLLFMNKLYMNNLFKMPLCKYCGAEHNKTRHQNISDCCSKSCANSYKNCKISYNELINFYINNEIPPEFIKTIDKTELASIYSNKKKNINKCHCGKFTLTTYCSEICRNKETMLNLNDFNREGFLKFIYKNKFDLKEATLYFNCSESTVNRYKKQFCITIRNKYTIEDDVIFELSKFINETPKRNDRSLIKPKEIDILYNDFAIEYNGLLWHSKGQIEIYDESKFDINYHLNKTNLCENKNIKLFHIFENEWKNKKNLWLNIINSYINKTNTINKGIIINVNSNVAQLFIDENYLENICVENYINLAMIIDNKIVSITSFENNNLVLFCSNLFNFDVRVIEESIHYYLKQTNYSEINVFFNRRWQHYILPDNFKFIKNTTPNKYYILNIKTVINEKDYNNKHTANKNYREIYDSGSSIYSYTEKCIN
jgi:hypothetical protein